MKVNRIRKKDEKNVIVYLDNDEKLIIALDVYYKSGIRLNDELSEDRFSFLINENKKYFIEQRALRFLNRRMHSVFELKQKLRKKDYEPIIIDDVINKLKDQNLLNDHLFAGNFIEEKIRIKKWGKKKLAAELFKKGIDRKISDRVLNEISSQELEHGALVIGQKKYKILSNRNYDQQTKKKKLIAFLFSKGYDYQTIKLVCERIETTVS